MVSTSALADELVQVLETWFLSSHYMKILKALDIDGDATVSKTDFVQLVTLAGKSGVSTEQFYASRVHLQEEQLSAETVIEHLNKIISVNNRLGNRTKAIRGIL
jgi:hypothetical protein